MSIQIEKALEAQLEAGLHIATSVKVTLKSKIGRNGSYVALNVVFCDQNGATASLMLPEFTRKIPTAFTALGKPMNSQTDISPEELLALRGISAEIHVVHRPSNGKIYANVSSINGMVVA